MSLHEKAINWVAQLYPDAIPNHYPNGSKTIKFGGLTPDIVCDKTIHEVEVIGDKANYKQIPYDKTLWIIVPSHEVFSKINIVGYTNNVFTVLHYTIEITPGIVLTEQLDVQRLKNEILELKTKRNRLIRLTKRIAEQHKIKTVKAKRTLYLLPSFQFEKELTPDKCIICKNESDVEIAQEGKPSYGLCQQDFDTLISMEEK